jgi:maltose alpha-D-glucosyltransferase/alpha-amylase
MGIDGLRLDAIPYLYEREGTNSENLPETHAFLKQLRAHVDRNFAGRMLLAEANQWPEDSVQYFGDGDECHMSFHFPVMPRMFMALRMEDRFPIVDILAQTPPIPENAQWALFLRNHDELTLEMVTDEERDYMYRVYAHDPQMRINLGIRRRLAPLLGNNRRRIELLKGLLFSLPGTPVIYYGDEIGMGDNPYLGDRNGVRTPMQWSPDRNAGFSDANPQRLYLPVIIDPEYHYQAVNVEAQQNNPNSLLWWTKRLIALRKRYKAFSRGTLEMLHPENRKVLAFLRRYEDEVILVVANLSRFVQSVELDLSSYWGVTPVELFGRTRFPAIGELPYFLTLGPHSFYWFALEPQRVAGAPVNVQDPGARLPLVRAAAGWEELFAGTDGAVLNEVLPAYLQGRRWFAGKARQVRAAQVTDTIPVRYGDAQLAHVAVVRVEYLESDPEEYVLPLACSSGQRAEQVLHDTPYAVIARLQFRGPHDTAILHDAFVEQGFSRALLDTLAGRRRLRGPAGEISSANTRAFRRIAGPDFMHLEPLLLHAEQSNTSVMFGNRMLLKLFRRLESGVNPDVEIGGFLGDVGFTHTPVLAGTLEMRRNGGAPATLAVLQQFVPNEGDAWSYTLDTLERYFEHALTSRGEAPSVDFSTGALLAHTREPLPPDVYQLIGDYLELARLLGQRTAEMHLALASDPERPGFKPQPFTQLYQRSLYQSMRNLTARTFRLLRGNTGHLPEPLRDQAAAVLGLQEPILAHFRRCLERRLTAVRIRTHGDYHLGQVLFTGNDFVIIDFEGEPARSLSERRLTRSPLRDVAGMLRSFHYAAHAALQDQKGSSVVRTEDQTGLEPWARYWYRWVSVAFLQAYLTTAAGAPFVPPGHEDLGTLLDVFLLEKAVYELGYELNSRPDWVRIPIEGIRQIIGANA